MSMDLLTIERVWEDEYFFEIRVAAKSKSISAECRSYTTEDAISELSTKLIAFPSKPNDSFLWENGIKGDQSTPFLSLEFMCEDKLGHILVEVYMEIDDGALYSKHNCCFYVRTEIGLCNKFGKALDEFKTSNVGEIAVLNPE